MIEVNLNDRTGRKVCVKCNEDDTIGDLKKLVAAQIGTRWEKIKVREEIESVIYKWEGGKWKHYVLTPTISQIQKWYTIYKDHITLEDYEIHDGMNLELYYN